MPLESARLSSLAAGVDELSRRAGELASELDGGLNAEAVVALYEAERSWPWRVGPSTVPAESSTIPDDPRPRHETEPCRNLTRAGHSVRAWIGLVVAQRGT